MMSSVQHTYRKRVRDLHRRLSVPVVQTMRLQDRGGDVRLSLQKAAYDPYDTVPDDVDYHYDPQTELVVLDLPGGADVDSAAWSDRCVVKTMSLQDRPDDVRLTLTRRAYDFEVGPPVDTVEQLYHPDTKIAAFELRKEPQGVARRALRPATTNLNPRREDRARPRGNAH